MQLKCWHCKSFWQYQANDELKDVFTVCVLKEMIRNRRKKDNWTLCVSVSVCVHTYWHACAIVYLCFSSIVGAGQYERYPAPTHPLWSWLNDPWPEDVHAKEKDRAAEEGQKGRRKEVAWGTRKKLMKTAANKAWRGMQMCPAWPPPLAYTHPHRDVPSPDQIIFIMCQCSPSSLLFVHLRRFHSLFLIHFFYQAHKSQLIKDRMKTANRALTCSPQWTRAEAKR